MRTARSRSSGLNFLGILRFSLLRTRNGTQGASKHAKSNQERQIETDLDAIAPYVDHMIATQGAYVLTPEDMDPCPLTEAEIEEIERDYALGSPHIER